MKRIIAGIGIGLISLFFVRDGFQMGSLVFNTSRAKSISRKGSRPRPSQQVLICCERMKYAVISGFLTDNNVAL